MSSRVRAASSWTRGLSCRRPLSSSSAWAALPSSPRRRWRRGARRRRRHGRGPRGAAARSSRDSALISQQQPEIADGGGAREPGRRGAHVLFAPLGIPHGEGGAGRAAENQRPGRAGVGDRPEQLQGLLGGRLQVEEAQQRQGGRVRVRTGRSGSSRSIAPLMSLSWYFLVALSMSFCISGDGGAGLACAASGVPGARKQRTART